MMRQVSADTQTAAVRREIRAVVNTAQRMGGIALILASLSVLWFAGYLLEILLDIHHPDRWPCGPVWAAACGATTLVAHGYQRWRGRRIRRQLAALTPLEREAIVWPLRSGRSQVGDFTRRVLRGLAMPNEVLPAAEGRGKEPAPM